jgi:hypothetical protein
MTLEQKEQRRSHLLFNRANHSLHFTLALRYDNQYIGYNKIGTEGAKALAQAIQQCKSLTTLHICIILG